METTKLKARKSLKDYTSLKINDPGMKISIDLSKNKNTSNDVSKEKSELFFLLENYTLIHSVMKINDL